MHTYGKRMADIPFLFHTIPVFHFEPHRFSLEKGDATFCLLLLFFFYFCSLCCFYAIFEKRLFSQIFTVVQNIAYAAKTQLNLINSHFCYRSVDMYVYACV